MQICSKEEQEKIISAFKNAIADRCELQDDFLKISEEYLDKVSFDAIHKFNCFSTNETAHNFLLLIYSFIQIRPVLIPLYGKLLIKVSPYLGPLVSPQELMILFSSNKLIVLNLLEANLIKIENIIKHQQTDKQYIYYFCNEIRERDPAFFGKLVSNNESLEDFLYSISPEDHDKKRRDGMNDGKFETMIREGKIAKVHPNSRVSNSMYENSEFLTNITYAEYAAFFGNVDTLKYYLAFTNLKTDKLLIYAIAGGQTDVVNLLLEQKNIKFRITHECVLTAINFHTTDDIEINVNIKEDAEDNTNITLTRFYTLSDNKLSNSHQFKLAKYSSWTKSVYDSENCSITISIKGKKSKNQLEVKGMKKYVNIVDVFSSMKKLNWRYFIDNLLYVSDQINESCDEENSTILHFACLFGYKEVVKLLLSLYGDKNYFEHNYENDTDFDYNPEIQTRQSYINVNAQDKLKRTPLHLAILNQKTDIIKILFKCVDTDFRIQDIKGKTVVHYAAETKNRKIIPLFFDSTPNHDIDMSIPDNKGNVAFHYFCKPRCFDPKILKFVCNSPRVNPNHLNHKNVTEVMHSIIKRKRLPILEILAQSDRVDLNVQTPDRKETALMIVAHDDNLQACQILMKDLKRINPNLQDYKLRTALHLTIINVSPSVFEFLIQSPKVNMNIVDDFGLSPVFTAIYRHCSNFFECILYAYRNRLKCKIPEYEVNNIDFDQRDLFSQSLLHYTIRSQLPTGIELLLKVCSINEPDSKGTSPFHQACAIAYLDIIKFVVSKLGIESEEDELQAIENNNNNKQNNSNPNNANNNMNNNANNGNTNYNVSISNNYTSQGQGNDTFINYYNSDEYIAYDDSSNYVLENSNDQFNNGGNGKVKTNDENEMKKAQYKPCEKIRINMKDFHGLTPFHYACQSQSINTVTYLYSLPGIKINEKDYRGIFMYIYFLRNTFLLCM